MNHPKPLSRRHPLTRSLLLAIAAVLVTHPGTAGTNPGETSDAALWPTFRGVRASGVVADAKLPIAWNVGTGEGVAWKTPVAGLAHSSPIVWGDRIYLTSAEAENEAELKVGLYGDIKPAADEGVVTWTLSAFDLEGREVWKRVVHRGVPKIKRHTKATHANSTPATDGETIVVMLGSEGLHAFDTSGEKLWSKDLGTLDSGFFLAPTAQWGFASSPILHDGKVIVQADVQGPSFLAAFSLEDGREVWRTGREEVPTWSTHTLVPRGEGEQIVVNGWKHIGGYDPTTGAELWRMSGGGDIPTPTPVVWKDLILITSAHGQERPIYAVRQDATGEVRESGALAWEHERAGNYMQTPIVVGDIGYFCMDNGLLTAYDLTSGEELYKTRLGSGRSGFTASPVATREAIYFTSEDGEVYVVAPGREFRQLALNELGEVVMATPAIAGDLLLYRTRGHLVALSKAAQAPTTP